MYNDRELIAAIRTTIKINLPEKFRLLEQEERTWGGQITVADYQIWIEQNIPLDSMEAAAIYSVTYQKKISTAVEFMNNKTSKQY